MTASSKRNAWVVFGVAAVLLAMLDLATKEAAFRKLAGGTWPASVSRTIEVVTGVLEYQYTRNPGIVFGQFRKFEKVFYWISIAAVPILLYVFHRMRNPSWTLALWFGFILGGAIGNMVDRLRFGAVQDFIYFRLIDFPIFNLADSGISVGTLLLVIELWIFEEKAGGKATGDLSKVTDVGPRPEERPAENAAGAAGTG